MRRKRLSIKRNFGALHARRCDWLYWVYAFFFPLPLLFGLETNVFLMSLAISLLIAVAISFIAVFMVLWNERILCVDWNVMEQTSQMKYSSNNRQHWEIFIFWLMWPKMLIIAFFYKRKCDQIHLFQKGNLNYQKQCHWGVPHPNWRSYRVFLPFVNCHFLSNRQKCSFTKLQNWSNHIMHMICSIPENTIQIDTQKEYFTYIDTVQAFSFDRWFGNGRREK